MFPVSSSLSTGVTLNSTAPSPLNMASSSGHQNNLGVASGSPTRDIALTQHKDSLAPPPLPSPPPPQIQKCAPYDYRKQKKHPQA